MPNTPPDRDIDWATNAQALVTTPGSSLITDGWVADDVPAASHFNAVMNRAAGYQSLLRRTLKGHRVLNNIDYTASSPFTTTNDAIRITYEPSVDRWYAITRDSAASHEVTVYDSADGQTWNTGVELDDSVAANNDISNVVIGNGRLGVACDTLVYFSTDFSVENIDTTGVSPASPAIQLTGLTFDPVFQKWYVCGDNGSIGYVYSCEANDTTSWTIRSSIGSAPAQAIASNGNGRVFVASTSASENRISNATGNGFDDVTTDPSTALRHVFWCDSLGYFVGTAANGEIHYSEDGDVWTDSGDICDYIFTAPDFLMYVDASDKNAYEVQRIGGGADAFAKISRGVIYGACVPDLNVNLGVWRGGGGTLVFCYDTDDKLAIASY